MSVNNFERAKADEYILLHRGDLLLQAVCTVLEDELERCKNSLLNAEDKDTRGKGQMCRKLLREFMPEDKVDITE